MTIIAKKEIEQRPVGGAREGTLADQAYALLRRDLLDGVFAPGHPLRLEALKERYALSFSPLREALTRLSADKLVVLSSLKGFRVARFDLQDMWDLISTRVLIETEALRRSIALGDDLWEASLVAAFHALMRGSERSAADRTADDVLEQRHAEFHGALIAACNSPSLIHLASQLYFQSERYRRPTLRRSGERAAPRDVMAEHQAIMTHAINRQADEAATCLADHYTRTGKVLEALLTVQP